MSEGQAGGRPGVYRFADCELDVARRELRRAGTIVSLQPKVFELLAYLIEHRDRAVDKSEIQDAIWPRVIVTETSLTQAIRKARRAVGDDANTQTVIRTVHGHGYRFVAPLVEEVSAPVSDGSAAPAPGSSAAPAEEPPPPERVELSRARPGFPTRLRHPSAWLAAAAVVLVIGFLWIVRPAPLEASGMRIAVLPVANETGDADLDWTRLGLMSLASSQLAAANLSVVADSDVMRLAADAEGSGNDAQTLVDDRLRRAHGATHVLATRLERHAGLLRFGFTLTDGKGTTWTETMVGEEPLALVRAAVRSVLGRLGQPGTAPHERHLISDDPFVNEAYARGRALALEGSCADAQALFRAATNQAPELFDPRYESAACARVLGNWQEAETLYAQLVAEEDSRVGAPSRALARALNGLGVVYDRTGRLDAAEPAYTRADTVAREIRDPVLVGDVNINLAILAENRGQFSLAREFLGRSMASYQEAGLSIIPGSLYATFANVVMDEGALEEADDWLAKAAESFRAVGDRRREALVINNLGLVRTRQGRYEEAIGLHQRSAEIRTALGDRVGLGWVANLRALPLMELGRLEEAESAALQALELARETRERLLEATSETRLADILLARGDLDRAEPRYAAARTIFVEIEDRLRAEQTDLRLARVALRRGEIERAEATGHAAMTRAQELKLAELEIEALELLGDAALARDDLAAFERHYRDAIEHAQAIGSTGKRVELEVHLADVYLEHDRIADAEPLLGLLVDAPESAALLRVRARQAYAGGDPAAAAALMERARSLAGERWSAADAERLALYRK